MSVFDRFNPAKARAIESALEAESSPNPEFAVGIEAAQFLKAYDTLMRASGRSGVIDSDLLPEDFDQAHPPMQFAELDYHLHEAVVDLSKHLAATTKDVGIPVLSDSAALDAKIRALYFSLIPEISDARLELAQQVFEVQGIDLKEYVEPLRREIHAQQLAVENGLHALGFVGDYDQAAKAYKAEYGVEPEEFLAEFVEAQDQVDSLQQYLGMQYDLDPEITLIDDDDTWTASTTLQNGKVAIELNRRAPSLMRGDGAAIGIHELSHALNFRAVADGIKKGVVNPGLGRTTLAEPRLYASEGLANTIHLAVPDVMPISEEVKFAYDRRYLRSLVLFDAHLRVNSPGYRRADVLRAIKRRYPFDDDEVIERDLEKRERNNINRAYNLVYPISEHDYRRHIAKIRALDDAAGTRMRAFLLDHFSHFRTPEQVQEMWREAETRRRQPLGGVIYSAPPMRPNVNSPIALT